MNQLGNGKGRHNPPSDGQTDESTGEKSTSSRKPCHLIKTLIGVGVHEPQDSPHEAVSAEMKQVREEIAKENDERRLIQNLIDRLVEKQDLVGS